MKTQREWVDFEIKDLFEEENYLITKEVFEEKIGDKFEAVKVNEHGEPMVIWTTNYVVTIVNLEIVWGDIVWKVAERNPKFD